MPTRYLKSGIRDSEAIDALSAEAETLFYRLLVTVDDFGRYDGRTMMIKAACFPIKESMTCEVVENLLAELQENSLIDLYVFEDKPYLQVQKWDNKPRAKDSKYPEFGENCIHLYASAKQSRTCTPLTETKTVTETVTETENRSTPHQRDVDGPCTKKAHGSDLSAGFEDFWSAYPKKVERKRAMEIWKRKRLHTRAPEITADVRDRAARDTGWHDGYVPNPTTYLNGERWTDEVRTKRQAPQQQETSAQRFMRMLKDA